MCEKTQEQEASWSMLYRLTQTEYDKFLAEAHLTVPQKKILDLVMTDCLSDEDMMEVTYLSRQTFYRVKGEIRDKMCKILPTLGIKMT